MIRHMFVKCWMIMALVLSIAFPLRAEDMETEAAPLVSMEHQVDLEYHGVKIEGDAGTASEYRYNHPGLGFGLEFKGHIGKKHLYIDSTYRNDRDYLAEGHLDINGRLKLNLSSERLWHNLEHVPYEIGTPGARNEAWTNPVGAGPRVTYQDQNPDDEYGLRIEIDKAEVVAKLGNYPAHLRLKYWRLQKEGERQLRFVDKSHDTDGLAPANCNACHMQSKTRSIDRLTEEFSGGVDTHVGFLDVTFEQLLRTFRVKDPIPVDTFFGHAFVPQTPTAFQHSEDPESQLLQSTVSLRTALTGGIVADGAYTYGKRENNSDLASATSVPSGVDGVVAESVFQKVAGNLSYTPHSALTVNLRYRMLDLDTENSDTITANYYRAAVAGPPAFSASGPPLTFPVRENMDLNRYEYAASAAWRPVQKLTIKGDFQRETIVRGNTDGPVHHSGSTAPIDRLGSIDPVWELPDKENIDQYRLSLTLRPLKTAALRLNGWYRYATSDNPAYGTSFDDKHEAFLGANYNSKSRWGLTATARALQEKNEGRAEAVWVSSGGVYSAAEELSDREREQQNYDFGLWVNPCSKVTTGFNYGYARSFVKQDFLFGATDMYTTNAVFDNIQDEVEYLQNSQNYSAFVAIQWLESFSTRVEGYYVRSVAKFKPNFATTVGVAPATVYPADSSGLTEISRLDVVQQGLVAALDWNPAERWTVGASYGIDDYDARNNDLFDGTVQTCMVSLSRAW